MDQGSGTVPTASVPAPTSAPAAGSSASPPASTVPPGVASVAGAGAKQGEEVLDKNRLQELVREVDPNEQLDEDVVELLLQIADDFIEQTVVASCSLAKHRKSPNVDVRDVQLVLEKNFNMWIPGVGGSGNDDATTVRQLGKRSATDAHKARMALIRKQLKKY